MADATLARLVRNSQFVFRGTVDRVDSSTVAQLKPDARTAVVTVDEVIRAAPDLEDFTGRQITVVGDPDHVKRGEQRLFFTQSWLFGESIAVVDVGGAEVRDGPRIAEEVAGIVAALEQDKLRERLKQAQLVIVGRVAATRPHETRSKRRQPITEHAPDWWEAVVAVESVEKGEAPGDRVTVIYPGSTDEFWLGSPKPEEGATGIWLLQRDQTERGWPAMRVPGWTALDPLDAHSPQELDEIRALLKGER